MARDLGEFEHGGVSESDARRVILVLFYWGYIIIGFILLFMNSFGSNSVGMKGDWNTGLINQF